MILTERKNKIQLWEVGDIVSDGKLIFLIVFDYEDESYRFVDMAEGCVQPEKYKTLKSMRIERGEFHPISHAELIFSD